MAALVTAHSTRDTRMWYRGLRSDTQTRPKPSDVAWKTCTATTPAEAELAGVHSRHRPRHDLDPFYSIQFRSRPGCDCAAGISANLSGSRPGRARSRNDLGNRARHHARGAAAGWKERERDCGAWHYQSARDHGHLGSGHRPAHP